jgi:hypothetical protein
MKTLTYPSLPYTYSEKSQYPKLEQNLITNLFWNKVFDITHVHTHGYFVEKKESEITQGTEHTVHYKILVFYLHEHMAV